MNEKISDRFYLKSFQIGFEVPFLNLEDPTGLKELAQKVTNCVAQFDSLDVGIDILKYPVVMDGDDIDLNIKELPNTNSLMLFYIVARVDSLDTDKEHQEIEWNKMTENLISIVKEFLEFKKLIYRIIK